MNSKSFRGLKKPPNFFNFPKKIFTIFFEKCAYQTSPAGGNIINRSTMDHSSSWKNPIFTKLYGLGEDRFQRWLNFAFRIFLAPPVRRPAAGCTQEALAVMIYFPLLLLLHHPRSFIIIFLLREIDCGRRKNEISGRPLSRTRKNRDLASSSLSQMSKFQICREKNTQNHQCPESLPHKKSANPSPLPKKK